jgi:hypothetical protein
MKYMERLPENRQIANSPSALSVSPLTPHEPKFVKAGDQFGDAALASAGMSDQRHILAGLNVQ